MPNYVPSVGYADADLAFVGEAPGKDEDEAEEPFVGAAGQVLNKILNAVGISRSDVWLCNISKYKLEDNDFSHCDLAECMPILIKELREVNPNCIVLLGDNVLKAFTDTSGVTKRRGSIVMTKYGFKAVIMHHPAAALYEGYKPYNDILMQADVKRALKESKRPDMPKEKRIVTICKSPAQLREWISRERSDKLACDIEVNHAVPVCIGFGFNEYRAMIVPLYRFVMGIKLTEMSRSDLAKCIRLTAKTLYKSKIIGQNFPFDQNKLECMGFDFSQIYADIGLMAQTIDAELPKALDFLTSIHTDINYYKDEGRDFNPRRDDISQFFNYCGKDIHSTFSIFNVLDAQLNENGLRSFFYDFVMKCYEFYYEDIRKTGFRIDFTERERLRQKYVKMLIETRSEVESLYGKEININSNPQVAALMKYLRIPTPRGAGEDVIVDILAKGLRGDPAKSKILKGIMKYRKLNKTLGTYVNAAVDVDGRMRTIPKQSGTETGRTATGILRSPERPWRIGMSLHGVTKHGEVGQDIRQFFIPDEDYCFLEVDSAQAEARVVAVLAEDYDLLENLKNPKYDMHIEAAQWAFSPPIDKATRQIGKRVRHASNYDMGPFRLVQLIQSDSFAYGKMRVMPLQEAERILNAAFSNAPKIKGIFHRGVQDCLYEDRTLRSPLGQGPGRMRYFFGNLTEKTFKEAYATIPQATVSDNTKLAMRDYYSRMKEWRKDFPLTRYLLESHDGVVFQVPIGKERQIANEFKELMERPISFKYCSLPRDYDLIIPAEISVSYTNWKELEENGFRQDSP